MEVNYVGNTTIIALNHDSYDEIEKDPVRWINDVLTHMRMHAGSDLVRIPGGEITTTFHRGDTEDWRMWNKFRDDVVDRQKKREASDV